MSITTFIQLLRRYMTDTRFNDKLRNFATRLRSSILGQHFGNQLLKRLHKNSTPQVATAEWEKNVSPCKKRDIIVDRVPCKE